MKKQFVFIDDSGDAGFKNSDTNQLIVAAVIVVDENKRKLLADGIDLFRRRLGWINTREFKFNKIKKDLLVELIDFLKGFEFKAYAVVLNKNDIDGNKIPKGKAPVYSYVMKELLVRVGKKHQTIIIDGQAEKNYAQKMRTYLRQSLKENGVDKVTIRFVDSRKESIVQLADIIAGAIARSYKNKTDAQKYLRLLKDKTIKIDVIKP